MSGSPWRWFMPVGLMLLLPAAAAAQPGASFLGKSSREWARLLESGSSLDRQNAVFALGKCNAAEYGEMLVRALDDNDEGVRAEAAAALTDLGGLDTENIVARLRDRALRDPSSEVRRAAVFALGRFKNHSSDLLGALQTALTDADPRVRQAAANAVGRLGQQVVVPCLAELIALLPDTDLLLRREAIKAIGQAGEKGAPAVPGLIPSLNTPDDVVVFITVNALGAIGPGAEDAFKPLLRLLRQPDVDPEISTAVMVALSRIGGDQLLTALPEMRNALKSPDPMVRQVACVMYSELGKERLTRLGPQGPVEFNRLVEMLQDSDKGVRQVAAQAIFNLFEAVQAVIPDAWAAMLHALEKEPDHMVRRYLAWTLLSAPRSLRFVPRAREILVKAGASDPDLTVRGETARLAVFFFGEEAEAVTETLIDYLNDKSVNVLQGTKATATSGQGEGTLGGTNTQTTGSGDGRVFAAQALRILGESLKKAGKPRSEAAKKALLEASKDPTSAALREEAKRALEYY